MSDATHWSGFFEDDRGFWGLVGMEGVVVPKVVSDFEFDADMDADEYLFLLAALTVVDATGASIGYQDLLYYSFDGGESMQYVEVMPAGALRLAVTVPPPSGPGMSDSGWCVVDDSTVIMGDAGGYVYKTENRGQ